MDLERLANSAAPSGKTAAAALLVSCMINDGKTVYHVCSTRDAADEFLKLVKTWAPDVSVSHRHRDDGEYEGVVIKRMPT